MNGHLDDELPEVTLLRDAKLGCFVHIPSHFTVDLKRFLVECRMPHEVNHPLFKTHAREGFDIFAFGPRNPRKIVFEILDQYGFDVQEPEP